MRNVETARQALDAIRPDYAVIDCRIGHVGGPELRDHIERRFPDTVVVTLDGCVDSPGANSAIDCLCKPVDPGELWRILMWVGERKPSAIGEPTKPFETRTGHPVPRHIATTSELAHPLRKLRRLFTVWSRGQRLRWS